MPDPLAPFQRTVFRGWDAETGEFVWEFRVQRGTGDWGTITQRTATHTDALEIKRLLRQILRGEQDIMADLTDITAAVEEDTSVDQSAITLLNQLAQMITDAGTDPVALADLTATIRGNSAALAAAVTANTPAA